MGTPSLGVGCLQTPGTGRRQMHLQGAQRLTHTQPQRATISLAQLGPRTTPERAALAPSPAHPSPLRPGQPHTPACPQGEPGWSVTASTLAKRLPGWRARGRGREQSPAPNPKATGSPSLPAQRGGRWGRGPRPQPAGVMGMGKDKASQPCPGPATGTEGCVKPGAERGSIPGTAGELIRLLGDNKAWRSGKSPSEMCLLHFNPATAGASGLGSRMGPSRTNSPSPGHCQKLQGRLKPPPTRG